MIRRRALSLLPATLVAVTAFAQAPADDVAAWLKRMNTAVEELNYRGTFVHVVDSAEQLRIVHRYEDGQVRERISATGENEREILRMADKVLTVIPDKRRVDVEEFEDSSIALASSRHYPDELRNYYDLSTYPKGEIAGRPTQIVNIRARDEYRYGYKLWLDQETALPLKSEVRDENGSVVEQILFTDIEVVESIPEAEVVPAIGVDGFDWRRPVAAVPEFASDEMWGATRLPNGFGLALSRPSLLAGSEYPVQHLVYSDGLATVSVYIAHPKSDADMKEGFRRFGSANMYSLKIDGRLALAVGEVPRLTVQRIATSLDAR